LHCVEPLALRLYPGSPDAKMRVIETGYMVDGHYLPPGTAVGVSIWTTHRDKNVWGEDHDGELRCHRVDLSESTDNHSVQPRAMVAAPD
jgi:hypothetical protein